MSMVGYTTVAGWIAVFASEKDVVSDMKKSQDPVPQVYSSWRLKNGLLKGKVFMSMDEARYVKKQAWWSTGYEKGLSLSADRNELGSTAAR